MLTYTFSTREKVLLTILAFVCVGIVWYQFVFTPIQSAMSDMDAQIATAEEQLVVIQARSKAVEEMRAAIADYEEQGLTPVTLPSYDNTRNLMAYLNGVLGTTYGYNISFDEPVRSEDGKIHRNGTITFGSTSYEDARQTLRSIALGPYPCQIVAVGITDRTTKATSSKSAAVPVATNCEVVFFERDDGSAGELEDEKDQIPEGNDWSGTIKDLKS